MDDQKNLWSGLSVGLGFEPKEHKSLIGISSQEHTFSGLALDETNKRVLVYSSELDPRMASMVHADASANLFDYKLITVRPLTFDFRQLANLIQSKIGTYDFDFKSSSDAMRTYMEENTIPIVNGMGVKEGLSMVQQFLGSAGDVLMPFLRASMLSGLNPAEQIVLLVRELTLQNWKEILHSNSENQTISLAPLAKHDSMKWDREYGLCPFPLYDLTEQDWETFNIGSDKQLISERLKHLGIEQYFNPPKDHAALAVVDRGIRNVNKMAVSEAILQLPQIGHPLADNELLSENGNIIETLGQLKEMGYLAEGEFAVTITESGKELRQTVKFRPREGVFSKLTSMVKLNIGLSPKDLT